VAICESINNNAAKLRICVGFNKQSMNELLITNREFTAKDFLLTETTSSIK
jgi:hypothetical protein